MVARTEESQIERKRLRLIPEALCQELRSGDGDSLNQHFREVDRRVEWRAAGIGQLAVEDPDRDPSIGRVNEFACGNVAERA